LPFFAGFLRDFKANKELARKPMKTEARAALIEDGKRTSERIGRALKAGDLDWFLGEYWTMVGGTAAFAPLVGEARKALLSWAKAANPAGSSRLAKMNVPAKQVAELYNCLLPEKYGMTPQSIGRAIGWKATAWAHGSKAYPVTWVTKQSTKELQRTIEALSQVAPRFIEDSDTADVVDAEPAPTEQASVPPVSTPVATASTDFLDDEELRQRFVQQLDVDSDVAESLVRQGLTTVEDIANAKPNRLAGIEGFDAEIAQELQARAHDVVDGRASA
jgi:transcription termination factor NusA